MSEYSVDIAEGKVRGFVFASGTGAPARGSVIVLETALDDNLWTTVGVLAADHAGYASFSLSPLRAAGRKNVVALRVRTADQVFDLPAFVQLDAPAPAFVMTVKAPPEESRSGLRSIQEPDDTDRMVSPGSFATPPMLSIGDEDCGQLIPGGLAGFEYGVYRVLRLGPSPAPSVHRRLGMSVRASSWGGEADNLERAFELLNSTEDLLDVATALPAQADLLPGLQIGVVLTFAQGWYPVGQCLGDIAYSLALAPGEARDLAMIDWSRTDSDSRLDEIDASEQLLHNQHRDRGIEEAMNAGLHEHQEGWSFMGGTGSAVSASVPIEGGKVGLSGDQALGVGISSSTGDRNLAGSSQQTLADTVTQSTTVLRGQRSTVIVQASQNESNTVQTRTIANHNRCHALTIEYYEVLRTYRIVTEFVSAQLALLVPHALVDFDATAALRWRTVLQVHLLDSSLAECFDALAHLERCLHTAYDEAKDPGNPPVDPGPAAEQSFAATSFIIRLDTAERETWGSVWVNLVSTDGTRNVILFKGNSGGAYEPSLVLARNSFRTWTVTENSGSVDGIGIDVRNIAQVEVEWVENDGQDAWSFSGIGVTATAGGKPFPILINDKAYYSQRPAIQRFDDSGHTHQVWSAPAKIADPMPAPVATPTALHDPATGKPIKRDRDADECCAGLLLGHLNDNSAYYSRIVWVGMDPTERRLRLFAVLGAKLADAIDDRPLAVGGNQVAFRLNGFDMTQSDRFHALVGAPTSTTRYASMPARGVFAEAELGRCNACERRDVTRAAEWSPIKPPQIGDVTPGPRGTTPQLQPVTLPSPVVQVVQTPSAPDPSGLAAALGLLGTPNIFRDMSGLPEVQQLLAGLTSGAVTLAQAQGLAAQAQVRMTQTATSTGAKPTGPYEPDAANQVDKLDAIGHAADHGLLTKEQADQTAFGVLGGNLLASADAGFVPDAGAASRPAQRAILDAMAGRPRLKESWDGLVALGWELRLTDVSPGNLRIDLDMKRILIDDINVSAGTQADWAEEGVKQAYQEDDDLRLKAIRDQGLVIFGTGGLTDLEKMARLCEWSVWFSQYPSADGDIEALMADMTRVLTDRTPMVNPFTFNDAKYNIFARTGGGLPPAGSVLAQSTGFQRTYRDRSNQVRHATAAIQISLEWGWVGTNRAISMEDPNTADCRLYQAGARIASGLEAGGVNWRTRDVGDILRRELGDPAETKAWTGNIDGDADPCP